MPSKRSQRPAPKAPNRRTTEGAALAATADPSPERAPLSSSSSAATIPKCASSAGVATPKRPSSPATAELQRGLQLAAPPQTRVILGLDPRTHSKPSPPPNRCNPTPLVLPHEKISPRLPRPPYPSPIALAGTRVMNRMRVEGGRCRMGRAAVARLGDEPPHPGPLQTGFAHGGASGPGQAAGGRMASVR